MTDIENKIKYYEELIATAKKMDTTEYTPEETQEFLNAVNAMERNLQLYYAIRNINI